MEELWQGIRWALGLGMDPGSYGGLQTSLRALVIYVLGLTIVRAGGHRFLGRQTAFDTILAFVLGSVLSRAVNGRASLLPTLVATAVMVGLHWLLAAVAFRYHRFGTLIKGNAHPLLEDGEILWDQMRRHSITRGDLEEALRLRGRIDDPAEARTACFERNGNISVLPKKGKPRVVDVRVEEGVQTVRIEIG